MEEEPKKLSVTDNENEMEEEESEEEDQESQKEESRHVSSPHEDDLNIVSDDPKDKIIIQLKESNQRLREKLEQVVEQATNKIHKESDQFGDLK